MDAVQGSLYGVDAHGGFTVKPQKLAASADPPTSKVAAEVMAATGKLSRHAAAVLKVIRAHPGHSYPELFRLAKEDGDDVLPNEAALQRRLSDLKEAKLIRCVVDENGEEVMRACTVHVGQVMTVFEAV